MSHFDKIFKQRLQRSFVSATEAILKEKFEDFQTQPTEFRQQIARNADFVFKAKQNQTDLVLHIEIQTQDDLAMLKRMYLYHVLLFEKYNLPVKQLVLFLGRETQMLAKKDMGFFEYQYRIILFSEIDYHIFLADKDSLAFAVLGKFEEEDLPKVLAEILNEAQAALSREAVGELILDLEILGRLRNFEKDIQTLTPQLMPIELEYTHTTAYKQGEEKGKLEGKLEGELKAKLEDARLMLLDKLPVEQVMKYTQLSREQVEDLQQELENKPS
jgi:predicted transposase/invertase (TIGR01784 family)